VEFCPIKSNIYKCESGDVLSVSYRIMCSSSLLY